MDEFPGLLARDFGFGGQDKSAPMAASKPSSSSSSSWGNTRSGWSQPDPLLRDPAIEPIFGGFGGAGSKPASSLPVFDKPVYDDDIFDGVRGVKSSSVSYDDVFASMMGSGSSHAASAPPYDDLLENLGKGVPDTKGGGVWRSEERKGPEFAEFDELIPGFGGSSPPLRKREAPEINEQKPAVPSAKPSSSMADNPFVVLETASTSAYSSSRLFADSVQRNIDTSSSTGGGIFDTSNDFDGLSKSVPFFTSEVKDKPKDKSSPNNIRDSSPVHNFTHKELFQGSSMESFENIIPNVQSAKFSDSNESATTSGFENSDQSPKSNEDSETEDDAWLTVAEIPLFTQPTSAPPPSRPPPSLVIKQAPFGANLREKENKYFSQTNLRDSYQRDSEKKLGVSPLDELEDFVIVKPQKFAYEEDIEKNSSAAASAAAKSTEFTPEERDAQDLEDREKQERLQREEEEREREEQKRLEKEREERERARARQAVERATREARERAAAEARLRAERAAVQRAAAEARERAAADARERATKAAAEARERAAAEARERAAKAAAEARERAAAEKAAVERAAAEARRRAAAEARERAAETRAAEAREISSAEARERAAAEARERVAAEAREKAAAERAAVFRAAAEARQRAERAAVERVAAEARERAAAAAREKMQKAENDLESFFGSGFRASSAPNQKPSSSDTAFNSQAQTRGSSDVSRSTSSGSVSNIRKASSTINIVDDLSSIFGAPPSSGEFQDIEGESEERRRARFERHQRTLERAAKALAEKNERDMQTQREQAERHRIAETLDIEIKRWAAGKEGNLRALLSTLHYVLWSECGWQAVSLTDLITAAAVKKVYRKATLCIHPDKVQQKGATLQQKYIAEKVFDLLKEAWNKFNSEELF